MYKFDLTNVVTFSSRPYKHLNLIIIDFQVCRGVGIAFIWFDLMVSGMGINDFGRIREGIGGYYQFPRNMRQDKRTN